MDFSFSEEELEEVLNIFQEESEEQIQKLNDNFLLLEENPQDDKVLNDIFREAHSLKGAARMIGLDDIQTIAHKLEDIFGLAKNRELIIKPEAIDIMCTAVDSIGSIIEDTVKTKGEHSIDVEAVVNQLKLIETGEIYNTLDDSEEVEEVEEPEEEIEEEKKSEAAMLSNTLDKLKREVSKQIDFQKEQDDKEVLEAKPEDIEVSSKPFDISSEEFSEDELAELKQIFYAESNQNIDKVIKNLSILRVTPYDKETLGETYRATHSLEGSIRIMGFPEIMDLAHSVRDLMDQAVKEETFLNSDLIIAVENNLKTIKIIMDKKFANEGIEDKVDLKDLENQIEKKMDAYKQPEEKPKRQVKEKISLSKDALSFEDDDVLNDLPTKQKVVEKKPKEKFKKSIEEAKKQLCADPLSLTDDEIGDMKLGDLAEIKPDIPKEIIEEAMAIEPEVQKSASTEVESLVKHDEKSLEDYIKSLCGEFKTLSFNPEDKKALNKTKDNIQKIKTLCIKESRKKLLAIIAKIETIIDDIDLEKITLTKDIALAMCQSVESAKSLMDFEESSIEDPALIYQRLMILHQTSKLSAGIPFEPETEPLIFKDDYVEEVEKPADEDKIIKPVEVKNIVESSKSKPEPEAKPVIKEKKPKVPEKKTVERIAPKKLPSIGAKSLTGGKSKVSPVGQITSEKKELATDAMESYTIKTLRVDTRKLDQLVAQVGELIIAKIKGKERLTDIEKLLNDLEYWQRDWSKTKYAVKNIDRRRSKTQKSALMAEGTSIYTPVKDMNAIIRENSDKLATFTNSLNLLYRNLQEDDMRLTLIINELENRIKNVRLLPLTTIFNMFPRMVRDIARQQDKEIELEIKGSDTTVDKKIIEEIKSPLMHIIRNAIDHGLESKEDREKNAKPKTGRILLTARHYESTVMIEIMDDGRGIDIEKIKSKVLEKELLTPSELAAMTETQIMNIIFWPGFSTGAEVTDISGRGVGMDVVHTKISQLNGKVKVSSKLGEGCKVSIQLPVTMSTIQVFLVNVQDQTYAVPTSAIKSVVLIKPECIFHKEGREAILIGGVPIYLSNLTDLLELPKKNLDAPQKDKYTVLVVQSEDVNIGFIVDGLLGDQEILHKNLEPPLIRVRNVAGVTTLGSGEVCLILNIGDLVKTAQMTHGMSLRSSYKKKEASDKKDILVVDDSVTTRILERNILRAAGYNVTVAVNGLDALTKLTAQSFDLVVSDVEMPDISGYELTKRIKADQLLHEIPVVLVTSLASEVDRQKGMNAGASAYITKGGFDQEELLGTIRRFIL